MKAKSLMTLLSWMSSRTMMRTKARLVFYFFHFRLCRGLLLVWTDFLIFQNTFRAS
jgi:hypothetical protein